MVFRNRDWWWCGALNDNDDIPRRGADIITLFAFPRPIRKAIYTTNAIESVNSVIRKFTRNRKIYPNADSALNIMHMAIQEAAKKWTMPIRNWKEAPNHFAILYEGRMPALTSN